VAAGRLSGAGKIGIRVGKVIGRYKMAKHYTLDITEDTFAFTRDQEAIITAEAALDGLYVIRTTVGVEQMTAAKVVATYKSLARVERDFRSLKSIDLDLRPITTTPRPGSAPTCSSACSPPTSSGTYAKLGPGGGPPLKFHETRDNLH
jgi:hypothetical protein